MLRIAWATPSRSRHLWDLLEPAQRVRVARLRHDPDRARSVTANALLRLAIGRWTGRSAADVRVAQHCRRCGCVTDHGRPILRDDGPTLQVSISHSADRVVVAACQRGPVGVDVELVEAARFDGFEDAALDVVEQADLASVQPSARSEWTTRAWTRKEALLKATGHGLNVSPARIRVNKGKIIGWPDDFADQLAGPMAPHAFDVDVGGGYVASAVVLSEEPPLMVVDRADDWLTRNAVLLQGKAPGNAVQADSRPYRF